MSFYSPLMQIRSEKYYILDSSASSIIKMLLAINETWRTRSPLNTEKMNRDACTDIPVKRVGFKGNPLSKILYFNHSMFIGFS